MTEFLMGLAQQMPFVALLGLLLFRAEKKNKEQSIEHKEERSAWRKEIIEFQEKYNAALLKGITAIEVLKERVSK